MGTSCHVVPTLSALLKLVHTSVVAVTLQTETANGKPLTVEPAAHKDPDYQAFMPKYLLKSDV
jgi:hypothetical protein